MNLLPRTAFVALALCGTGCMPGVYTGRPEIRGTVVAAGTGEPIRNATVAVEQDRHGNPTAAVTSDEHGAFRLPRVTYLGLYWLTQGQARWAYAVRAEAPGLAAVTVEVSEVGQMPPRKVVGVRIELSGG